jgi:hypothetical protein
MVESFFQEMSLIIFSEYLDLAAQVVIRALDQLEFALVFVSLQVLSLDLVATLVVTLNHFKQTALVVGRQIFVHYQRIALLVWTVHSAVVASYFVSLHVLPLKTNLTKLFKQTFSFVGTFHNF